MSSQVQVEENVGKGLRSIVGVDPNTVYYSQTIVQKQRTIKASHILVSGHYHGCVERGQTGLVCNHSIGEMVGSGDVFVENEGVLSDTIVFFLNVM
jgi:tRNA G37 N-methylase TrmD